MSTRYEEYKDFVESLDGELPSIPLIMNELLEIISDSNAALYAIQEVIKMDKTIFSKILKHANSVEMRQGAADRIVIISDAIHRLGFEKVKKIILNTSILELFQDTEPNFDLKGLWMHSCGVAIASDILAERFELKLSKHAYSCGLLHDLGKVAKLKFSQKQFFREIRYSRRYNCTLAQSEKRLGGIEHDLLGSMIIQKWGISPIIEQTTQWHHTFEKNARTDVEDPDLNKLIDIICLANWIIKDLEFGICGNPSRDNLTSDFLKRRKIDEEELIACKEIVQEALESESEHLSIFSKV